MKTNLFDIQLFAEGGDGASSAGADGFAGSEGVVAEGAKGRGKAANPLADVIYGTQTQEGSTADPNGETDSAPVDKSKSFEELIKGEYKDEFTKRTQSIIDKRFKEVKGLEEQVKSHEPLLKMLSEKYGVDASDPAAMLKALEDDESFYQEEAMRQGLTIEQLKEVKRLQRENEAFRQAKEEAEAKAHSEEIYARWLQEAEELKAKYNLESFDLQVEAQNPEFVALLSNPNISLESAYKAVHMDEMLSGAMATTASKVREQMAASIASRQARPAENGVSSTTSQQFKSDVNALSKADREEIERRVMRGAIISF